jgi:hypothetical protein
VSKSRGESQLEPADAGASRALFDYEIRREGRVVARLHGEQAAAGITVETSVFPVTAPRDAPALTRPFTFGSVEHARRFADEAIVVFEYLNCTMV